MSNIKGKSIKLFMVEGSPHGIITLEVMNWTGHVLAGPRTKISELVQRPEMAKTGIYFLTGPDPEGSARPMVYIGESDNVGTRLKQHNKDEVKDFWERAFIITSKDQNLTKAHVRYLEGRFISIVQNVGNAKLFNNTAPKNENLPEADIADMEYFIAQVRLILPVLGLEFLREKPNISYQSSFVGTSADIENISKVNQAESPPLDKPIFEIHNKKDNLHALATEVDGDFVVFSGSETRSKWKGSAHNYKKHFDTFVTEGKIRIDQNMNKGVFQEDVPFSSPSAAAAMVLGRASNGRTEWKVRNTKKTYDDWQNDKLNKLPDGMAA